MQGSPPTPHDQRGAGHIGTGSTAAPHQPADAGDRGEGDQPGDLPTEDVVEEPPDTGRTGEPAASTPASTVAATVALATEDPPEAVVAHDQIPGGAVAGTADVGPFVGGHEGDRGSPPEAGDRQHHRRQGEVHDPLHELRPGRVQIDGEDDRQRNVPLKHLGVERQPEAGRRAEQRQQLAVTGGAQRERGTGDLVPNPKTRHDSPMTISANGGLSAMRKFPASNDPKNHAFQLSVPLSTAAL